MMDAQIWIIAGVALMLAEFALMTFVVLFFGFAAVLTGLLVWAGMPQVYGLEFFTFAMLSILTLVFLRRRFEQWLKGASVSSMSADLDSDFVGHRAEVVEGFDEKSPDQGVVRYRGVTWRAECENGPRNGPENGLMSPGAEVLITSRMDTSLSVRSLKK